MSNIDNTLAERGNRYGDFVDHAEVTQSIKVSIEPGMSTIDKTLEERGARYGSFTGHAEITQGLRDVMKNATTSKWADLSDAQKEALEMVAHKIGRILNGDPTYIDSWTDIIGYTRLVEKRLIEEQSALDNTEPESADCDCGLCQAEAAAETIEEQPSSAAVIAALAVLIRAGTLVESTT